MRRFVKQQGHTHNLFVTSLSSSCGDIDEGGIAFEFGDCHGHAGTCAIVQHYKRQAGLGGGVQCYESGAWLISLDDLKAIVAEAEAHQYELVNARSLRSLAAMREAMKKPDGDK